MSSHKRVAAAAAAQLTEEPARQGGGFLRAIEGSGGPPQPAEATAGETVARRW